MWIELVPGVLQPPTVLSGIPRFRWLLNEFFFLEQGVFTVEVEAMDLAGNPASTNFSFGFASAPQLNPTVLSITPRGGERLNTSLHDVRVVVADNSGAGIDPQSTEVTVTGPNVSAADTLEVLLDTPAPDQVTFV